MGGAEKEGGGGGGGGEVLPPTPTGARGGGVRGDEASLSSSSSTSFPPFSSSLLISKLVFHPFLPAAKPAGHRTESVVLVVVVVVVGVSLSPARISYPNALKNDCVGNETELPDFLLIFRFSFYIMATLFTFPTHPF